MGNKIFETTSALGYKVCCYRSNWKNHISSGHPIMVKNIEAVQKAVEKPEEVYQSNEWPQRDVYFGRCTEATYGDKLFTKVIVEVSDDPTQTAYVVSAWPQKDIKGNISQGGLKYVKPKL